MFYGLLFVEMIDVSFFLSFVLFFVVFFVFFVFFISGFSLFASKANYSGYLIDAELMLDTLFTSFLTELKKQIDT